MQVLDMQVSDAQQLVMQVPTAPQVRHSQQQQAAVAIDGSTIGTIGTGAGLL